MAFGVPETGGSLRPRLLRHLDGVTNVRLTTIVAPAGHGKTTLMAQWARRAPSDIAWYRADPADTGPIAVLARIGETLNALLSQGPIPDLDSLLGALNGHHSTIVLVIDDLHRVADPEVIDALQSFLLRAPPNFHLLASSRTAPQFNFACSELSSMVIGPSELRFRSSETADLFRTAYAAPLSSTDCLQLTQHTGGWVAALHLFHHSVAGLSGYERHRAVRGLTGRVRYARAYLAQEIFADVPVELLTFLRRTSLFESLTARRCDQLLASSQSQHSLLELESRGLLAPSSDAGAGFSLPSVLRAHLMTELRDELGDAATDALLCDAARILADDVSDGCLAEAVRAYAAAGAWTGVLGLLAEHGSEIVTDPDLGWLDSVPSRLGTDEPWLRLAAACRALRDGQLEATAELAILPAAAHPTPTAVELSDAFARFARLWTAGDVEPNEAWFERLRETLRRPRPTQARTGSPQQSLLHAIELAICGNLRAARQCLSACGEALHDDLTATLTTELVDQLLTTTESTSADALADRAQELGMPWFARMARGLAATRAPNHAVQIAQHVHDAEGRGDHWGAALLCGMSAIASLRAGDPDLSSFEDLAARFRALDTPALEAWSRAGLALAAAAHQLPDAVREGESAEGFARTAGVPGALAVSYGALALSAPGHASKLMALADAEAEAVGLDCRPWTWVATQAIPAQRASIQVSEANPLLVRCFGRFELRVGGSIPALTRVRPRARAVLRLLALQAGRPIHREMLIDALWPDLHPEAATHNLHVCISSLRAVLEPGVHRGASRLLVRDDDRYTLRLPSGSHCDLRTFDLDTAKADQARAAGDVPGAIDLLGEAVRQYTGDVLPEDGPAEWAIGPREHYRMRAAEAAALLGELHLSQGDASDAAASALRSIDVDPCRDGSWRLLLAAYRASGDLAAAERTRRAYADVLASLGVVTSSASAVLPSPEG